MCLGHIIFKLRAVVSYECGMIWLTGIIDYATFEITYSKPKLPEISTRRHPELRSDFLSKRSEDIGSLRRS